MLKRIYEKLQEWYNKPAVKTAIDAGIIGYIQQFVEPRGYQIVPVEPSKSVLQTVKSEVEPDDNS